MGSNEKMNILNDGSVRADVVAGMTTSGVPSLFKTKVLKPFIVDGMNVLRQEDMALSGYKYVVKYCFDLRGLTVEVPENCILEFDGGCIANGELRLNGTKIVNIYNMGGILDDVVMSGEYSLIKGMVEE